MKSITVIMLILLLIIFNILLPLHSRNKKASQIQYKPNKPQSYPYMDLRLKRDDDEDFPDEYI